MTGTCCSSLSDWGFDLCELINSAANRAVSRDVIHDCGGVGLSAPPYQIGDALERCAQPGLSAYILLMFQAIVTRLHSPRTLSSPRSRNWRNPITDLMMPNTGSGVCLRRA